MQEKNSGILEVLNSNTSSSLLDAQLQDIKSNQQDQKFGFEVKDANTTSDVYTPRQNRYGIKLTSSEERNREVGTTQAVGNVIRVSDSSTALDDTDFKSARELYENVLGVTQYDSLRSKLGLKDGESYTDYYNRTGYIPAGFEIEAKLLLAEEKRKKLYSDYVAGKISETDFLYNAYGKDIMKAEGHDLNSTLYWYQRRKKGLTDSPLDNDTYLAGVIYQAREQFEAETWFEKSQTNTLNNSLASYLAEGVIPTGEELDAVTLRELFPEQFAELDQYYESSEKIIDLYRAGLLSGFDPTIDVDGDGKVDYYYHTNGKLYAIEGSSGVGSAKAQAHYNKDGSLNRITLTGSEAGEIGQQVIKGFTNILTEAVGFVGMFGGGIVDLVQGITGNGWDLSATTDVMTKWNKLLNEDSFWVGNDGYIIDSGFKTSDGNVNWMGIGRGAGAAIGTVAEIALTIVASIYTGGGAAALKVGSTAVAKGAGKAATKIIGKKVASEVAEEAVEAVVKKGIKELGEKAVKTVIKEASEEVLEAAAKKAVKEMGEEITQEALEKAVKKGLKEVIKEAGQEGAEYTIKKGVKEVLDETGQKVMKETVEKTLKSTVNNTVEELGTGFFKEATKQTVGKTISQGVNKAAKGSLNFILKTTGVSNGTPIFSKTVWGNTLESVAIIGVKDFLQTGAQLTVNQERLDLTTGEIVGKAFGVAALNVGISLLFRSVQDTSALDRWAILAQKNVNANANARLSKGFLDMINGWQTKSFRSFMAANTAMDLFENMSTMYFQNSVSQTGELFNAEVFKNTFSNPQMVFTQAALAYQSVKGGFGSKRNPLTGQIAEGAETGSIVQKIGNIQQITDDVITYLKKASANVTDPEDARAISDLIIKLQTDMKKEGDPLTNMSEVLVELHNAMQDEQGNSFVRDIITKAVDKRISEDTIAEMQVATKHYNSCVNAYNKLADDTWRGKVGQWFNKRQKAIIDLTDETIKAYCTTFDSSSYSALLKAFTTDLSSRKDASEINSYLTNSTEVVSINGIFEWHKDAKTGKFVYTIKKDAAHEDPDTVKAIKKFLEDGYLSAEDLRDAKFLRVKGVGTNAEGSQAYKDITDTLYFYSTITEQDQRNHDNARRLIYRVSDKNDLYLIPGFNAGLGIDMANIHNIGEALRAIHIMRYSQDPAVRLEMLKLLPNLFLGNDDDSDITTSNLLKALYDNKLLTMSQASSLAAEFDKADYDALSKLDPKPSFLYYKEGYEKLKELEALSDHDLTDSERNKVRVLLNEYKALPDEVRAQLLKDDVVSREMISSVEATLVNPHKSQDHYNLLNKFLNPRSENEQELNRTIKFLATLLENPTNSSTHKVSFEEFKNTITDSKVKEFLGSDLMKGIDITKLTNKELEAKMLEYSNSKNPVQPIQQSTTSKFKLLKFENGEDIVYNSGRAFVYVELPTGERFPFYLSSGTNPKPGVTPGTWYPFFGYFTTSLDGIDPDAWINKGSSSEMANYYNSTALKDIAQELNKLYPISPELETKLNSKTISQKDLTLINELFKVRPDFNTTQLDDVNRLSFRYYGKAYDKLTAEEQNNLKKAWIAFETERKDLQNAAIKNITDAYNKISSVNQPTQQAPVSLDVDLLNRVSQELLNYKKSLLSSLKNSEDSILHDLMLTRFKADKNIIDMDVDFVIDELLNSPDFFTYYNNATTPRNLTDRLKATYELHQDLYSDTLDIEADNHIYLDLTKLVGATHAKMLERLTNPTVRSDLANCDSELKFIRTVFGDKSYQEISTALAKEEILLTRLRESYPDGYVSFDMTTDIDKLNKLFKDLGYNYAAIVQNEHSLIPGVYFKKGYGKALEFKLSKQKKNDLLSALGTRLGYNFKQKEITERRDIISQLESLLGGLVYIDDDTTINPSRLILTSIDGSNGYTFSGFDSVRELYNALGKQGKLAGAASKGFLAISNYEIGVKSAKNKDLRDYELLLSSIDILSKLYKDSSSMAVSRLLLTDAEAEYFKANGLWAIEQDNVISKTTPDGVKHSYVVKKRSDLDESSFKEQALALLKKDTADLNLICPVYSCEHTDTDLIMNAYGLNYQTTLGYSPITQITQGLYGKATKEEILNLFSNATFKNKYTEFEIEPVLKFFTGTVAEIKAKEVTQDLLSNPYYHMMRNSLDAALETSKYISQQAELPNSLFKLLGNNKTRRLVGATLFNLGEDATEADIKKILLDNIDKLDNIQEAINNKEYLEYLDYSDKDSSFFSGNQTTIFNPKNQVTKELIEALSIEDIKALKELVDYSIKLPNNFSEVEENVFTKLFNHLQTSKSSIDSEDTLHLFVQDLYHYTEEEFTEIKEFLSHFLSAKDIKAIENKFNVISKETDLYNNTTSQRDYGDRLIQHTGSDATFSHYLQAISKVNDKNSEALFKSISRAEESLLRDRKKKLNYKISDVDSISHNADVMLIRNLASLLNIKVLDGVNRQGSLLIQNIEIKEKLGQLVNSIAETSVGLKDLWQNSLGSDIGSLPEDTFHQIALAMYLHSTGMDYQSEWTKYLFINVDTGEIEHKAQAMSGARSLNDLLYTAMHVFQDVDSDTPSRYIVLDLEKNMFLSNSLSNGTLKYSILDKTTLPKWRSMFVENALYQWNNNPFFKEAASSLNLNSSVEKAVFVYSSTPTQKRIYEDIVQELISKGVNEKSARLAIQYSLEDLQSSKSTNSAAEQLFINDMNYTTQAQDREAFNIQQKTLSDVLKYNLTYRGLSFSLQQELSAAYKSSDVLTYTTTKTIKTKKKGTKTKTITHRIEGAEDVIQALLSGNKNRLTETLTKYKYEQNKGCSEEQLMQALAYTYLYNSKEASAVSFLLSGNDFEYFKTLKNNVADLKTIYKGKEILLEDLFSKGLYSIDTEGFYDDNVTEPFQITVTYIDAQGQTRTKEIFRHVYDKDGNLVSTENQIRALYPEFTSKYLDTHEGTKLAVKKYLDFVNKNKPVDVNKEINAFMSKDLPVLGFNSKAYDNKHMESLLNSDSYWFRNSVDAYEDIFKKVVTSLDLTNKENLSSLVKQLHLDEQYKLDAHDATSDTLAAYLVTKHIIDSTIDANKFRLDMFNDLETLGKKFVGENFTIDSLKDLLESDSFKFKSSIEENISFINTYKTTFKDNDILAKATAIRKIQSMYDSQELEVNTKRYRKEYAITFTKDQRDIVDAFNNPSTVTNISKVINYIKDKSGVSLDALMPSLSEAIRDVYGIKGSFKEKQLLKLLADSPEDIISKLTNKHSLLKGLNLDEFKGYKNSTLSSNELEAVKNSLNMLEFSKNLYDAELEDKFYSFNKSLNEMLDDNTIDFLDDDLKNHLFVEANRYYTDTRSEEGYVTRAKLRQIRDGLTEQQLEFLQKQPVRRIELHTIYDLVQALPHDATLRVLDFKGKSVVEKVHSDTIYVSPDTFEKLMGMSYTTARKLFQTKEGDDIYFTAMRHPADKPDAIQNYKLKVTTTKNVNIMMSPDVLKALHGGDNDGDHLTLIKPSKATQEFAKTILPITKASYTMLDTVLDKLESKQYLIKNPNLSIGNYEKAMDVLKDVVSSDLSKLVSMKEDYVTLKAKRKELLKAAFPNFSDSEIETLMDVAWITQAPLVNSANLVNNFAYYSYSKHLSKNELNTKQLQIANDHKATLRDINSYADSVSGVIQKNFGKHTVINSTVKVEDLHQFFQFAPFNLAPNTIATLKAAINNPSALETIKTTFSSEFVSLIKDSQLQNVMNKTIADISSVEDFMFAMKLYEDYVKADNVNVIADALHILNSFNKDENVYEEYDTVLRDYLKATQNKFFDTMASTEEMMDALLDGTQDYFSNSSLGTDYVSSMIQAKLRDLRHSPNVGGFNPTKYEDFSNKVRGKIVYALNPQEDIPEDTMRPLPGSKSVMYSNVVPIEFKEGEKLIAPLNKVLKPGDPLTNTSTVPEYLEGYKVVKVIDNGYIIVKSKGIDGTSKIGLPGSSATKVTMTLDSDMAKYYVPSAAKRLTKLFEGCIGITKMSEFNFAKLSGKTYANSEIKYYDINGNELSYKNKSNAAYAIVDTNVGIAEDTSFWDTSLKSSILDDVTIGMNAKSLEGQVILGKYLIPSEAFTDSEFTLDNSKIIKIEQALERMRNPRYLSSNGTYAYKALLLTTLLQLDTSMTPTEKRSYLKLWLVNKKFAGSEGTKEIGNRIKAIKDLDQQLGTLPKFQQNLFNKDLLCLLFNQSPSKFNLDGDTSQLSKKSHGATIKAIAGAYGPSEHVTGALPEQLNIRADGTTVHSISDSYIPLLALRQTLQDGFSLSAHDAQTLTERGKIPKAEGYSGTQTNDFSAIDKRFAKLYSGEYSTNVDPKTGMSIAQINSSRPSNIGLNIVPSPNDKIDIPLSGLDNLSSRTKASSGKNYADLSTDRITKWLLAGLSAHAKHDKYGFAHSLFKSEDDYGLSLSMHRRKLTAKNGDVQIKAQQISDYTNTDVFNYYKAINNSFSSAQSFDNYRQSYETIINTFKDEFDSTKSTYLTLPILEETAANSFHLKVTPKVYDDALKYTSENSHMPREYYEGRDDRMQTVYKEDLLETSGIKLDSEAAINADRIAKYLKTEGEAITLELNNQYFKLFHMAEVRQVTSELNEYAFLSGTLDRIARLETIKDKDDNAVKAIEALTKSLPYSIEECKDKIYHFESLYPEIIEPFKEMTTAAVVLAQRYAHLTLEPTTNPFFLLVPNVYKASSDSSKGEVAYMKSMFLNTSLYINPSSTKQDYATYAGYNFFQSMPQMLKQIASQAAIYNGSQRLKRQGYMQNATIFTTISNFFNAHENELKEIEISSPTKKKEFIDFNRHILCVEFDNFEDRYKTITVTSDTAGAQLFAMYETLKAIIEDNGNLSYADARRAMLDTSDSTKQMQGELVTKAYEYSNDILANLCDLKGNNLLEQLGRDIYNHSSYAVVDTWGRKLDPDLTKFKTLSKASLEYIPSIIKYHMGGENTFYKNIALDAINGDVYYMPKTLSDILDKEVFVSRPPKTIQKHLIKLQNVAVKLLMSSPFKLPDRILKYSGFDLATLSMANAKTLLKQSQARTELSALWGSKGSILDKTDSNGNYTYANLREFLYTQGIDPNSTDLTKLIQGETGSVSNKGPLQGYFDLTNKAFSYQNLFERYAFWLATKEDLQKGRGSYGSVYHKKDLIDSIEGVEDTIRPGVMKVSKEGNQAAFIMAQNIGAPGDFPALAKRLQGYATFTTFPLALLRWGKGEIYSMGTAFKNLFVEGETRGALKQLAYNGGGILGIYLVTNLLTSVLCDMFNIPEEQEEEWKEEQAIPDIFKTIIQGSPVMDTYSSVNPLKELGDLTISPIIKPLTDDDKETDIVDGLRDWFLTNIVSHVNPAVKGTVESLSGYDVIGNDIISTKDEYSIWENFARKAGAYLIGSAGANAMTNYSNSYESEGISTSKKLSTGLLRAVEAELGNTKVYKSNQKNYYKAMTIVNTYLYSGKDGLDTTSDLYKSLKSDISKALHNKAKMTDIYSILEEYISKGASYEELKSALNNNSLRYKLTRVDASTDFLNSLTDAELNCVKSALAYEDYIFPWIDTIIEDLQEKYNKDSDPYYKRIYDSYYPNSYYDYDNSYYKSYNNSNNYIKQLTPYTNYNSPSYSPSDTFNYMMDKWKYGKATDLYGNKYSGYTNIKGDTWTYGGKK
jgi:hypothetical protein